MVTPLQAQHVKSHFGGFFLILIMNIFKKKNTIMPAETKTDEDTPFRKEGETQQEYNERISPAIQPVLPPIETTYLGDPR